MMNAAQGHVPSGRDMLFEEGFQLVSSEADPSWRHGCYMLDIYKEDATGFFYKADYRRSGDGETNELREGLADIRRVYPFERVVTVTEYRETP